MSLTRVESPEAHANAPLWWLDVLLYGLRRRAGAQVFSGTHLEDDCLPQGRPSPMGAAERRGVRNAFPLMSSPKEDTTHTPFWLKHKLSMVEPRQGL